MWRSVRQTQAPAIRTMTSKGPVIEGSGASTTLGGWLYSKIRAAFILASSPVAQGGGARDESIAAGGETVFCRAPGFHLRGISLMCRRPGRL
jgi:hypothetical protein